MRYRFEAGSEQRQHHQRIAEDERQHDSQQNHLAIAPAEAATDSYSADLTDDTSGETVIRCAIASLFTDVPAPPSTNA
jgi:hypothetical protein